MTSWLLAGGLALLGACYYYLVLIAVHSLLVYVGLPCILASAVALVMPFILPIAALVVIDITQYSRG